MSGLILLSIALTCIVVALCTMLYRHQVESFRKVEQQQEMLANLDTAIKRLCEQQNSISVRVGQLANDVLQREIYQNADDRHQLAIESAKQGNDAFEITQRHGLSSDEAALIVSLHSPHARVNESVVKNANLFDPTVTDVV